MCSGASTGASHSCCGTFLILTHELSWAMRQAATVPLAPNRTSAIAAHLVFKDHERPEEELAIVTAHLSTDPKKESYRSDEVRYKHRRSPSSRQCRYDAYYVWTSDI